MPKTAVFLPAIFDVFKEGMHLTSLDNGVWFDFNSDGKPLHMAWTDPNYHNAFLALDRNHNGKIDGIQELFGALTQPQIKTAAQPNGWLALADYDTPAYGGNADNVINGEDAIYSQLLLWIDENHDGISQPSELHHLAELGVTAIELKYDSRKSYTDRCEAPPHEGEKAQKLIWAFFLRKNVASRGPCAHVRHPRYAGGGAAVHRGRAPDW